ncbi:MAG: class I SAM-dependent methyltransferase [Thiobacillaceae bacterium]
MNLHSFAPQNLAHKAAVLIDRTLPHKLAVMIEKCRGLDFSTVVQPEAVGLDPGLSHWSSPSRTKYLAMVLNDFKVTSRDSIIDVGCGKGSAMRTMLRFPFAHIDGVELSDHLGSIAKRNFERLNASRTNVFVCNAALLSNYDLYNIVYFFNPFPCSVMSLVVDRLVESLNRKERELVLIYNNATCNEVIVGTGIFATLGFYPDRWGNGMFVYSNYRGNKSRLSGNMRMQRHSAP